jgi:hypothetical protein
VTALPALVLATDAVRAQFASKPVPEPEPAPARSRRYRLALAHLLERAARAVAPVGATPAH